jgi:predicted nucleic acid-binding protein
MILDTNAVSALSERDPHIPAALKGHSTLFVPVIVIGEYRYGIGGSRKRQVTETWFNAFLQSTQILHVSEDTALHYAVVRHRLKQAGTPIPENDVWIAALAIQFGLPLLSRDLHFDKVVGLRCLHW